MPFEDDDKQADVAGAANTRGPQPSSTLKGSDP